MTLSSVDLILQRAELRSRNKNPAPLRTAFRAKLSTLKSDLKKATTLAKRFKNYSAESSEKIILAQLDTLNFGMFLSEAAEGVVQSLCHGTKMKSTDVSSFVLVCSEVHQRYEGFWPLVQKGLKESAEKIVDVNLVKTAIERINESAELTRPTESGDGNVPLTATSNINTTATITTTTSSSSNSTNTTLASGTVVTSYTSLTPSTSATASNSNSGSISKVPMEEFNRLRIVARVFSEWWLVGLLEEAKPLLKLLKLMHIFLEKHTSSSSTPLVASTILSIILLIVRKVGIELLGKENTLFSSDFNKEFKEEKLTRHLHDLSSYSGEMVSDQSKTTDATVFLLGPVGSRLTFNPTTKSVVHIDDTLVQQMEELSWARLCETYKLPEDYYCKHDERQQFASLLISSARTSLKIYNDRKEKLETKWHSMSESHGRGTRNTPEDIRFRLFQEYVEEFYVLCDNLLGMLGFKAPNPIDLSIIEPKITGEIKITSVAKVFHTVKNAESYNRFEDDEKRIFYEYLPDLQVVLNDLKPLYEAGKANWDLLLRRQAISGAVVTESSSSSSSSSLLLAGSGTGEEVRKGVVVVESEECEIESTELDTSLENSEESRFPSVSEAAAMMKRRRLRMVALAVPASLFDNYSTVLQLLEELLECNSATTIDDWCDSFLQEALRPLRCVSESAAGALLFFSNCLMLLSLELRDYPRTRYPEMLPYMARCAAIMYQYFPQIGEFLGKNLEAHWRRVYKRYTVSESDIVLEGLPISSPQVKSIHLQSLRHIGVTVRYLCELMKFDVIPPSQVINMMVSAVDDLTHPCSAVTLTAAMKHGGLFLLRNHPTHIKTDRLFQKLKKALPVALLEDDVREMIKSAFHALTPPPPPPRSRHSVNTSTPSTLEQYARYLLQSVLSSEKYDFVRTQFLRMPWADVDACRGLLRALRALQNVRWDAVPLVAELVADLSNAGLTSAMQCIIDEIIEDFRRDIEVPASLLSRTITGKIRGEGDGGGGGGGGGHVSQKDSVRAVYRVPQWRFIDCVFLAHLYRGRVLTIRFIGYMVAMLLLYNPFEDPPKDDHIRLRCCVTLLTECAPSFPWWRDPLEGTRARIKRRIFRMRERLATVHQLVRKFVALLLQHRYSLTEPIPLDLLQRLEELISFFDEHMRRDVKELKEMPIMNIEKPTEEEKEKSNDEKVRAQLLQEAMTTPGLPSLATAEEVSAFIEVVKSETVHPDNLWYEKVCEAVMASCRDDAPLFRVFPSRVDEKPLGCEIERKETTEAWGEHVDSDVLLEETVLSNTVAVDHISDADENSLVCDSEEDSSSCYSSSSSSSCDSSVTTCSEGESSHSSGSNLDDIDDEETESGTEVGSYTVNDTSSVFSKSGTEVTYEEEDDEEEEEEEEEDDDEEEEEIGQENENFTAAEALRMRLEEAELDAELNALMSRKPHETLPHAALANSKAGGMDRLEQELAMGIRLYRQQQQQQQRSSTTTSKPNEEQEIRFTLLRRPMPGTSTTGKTGSTSFPSGKAMGSKGNNNNNNNANDNNVVLRIPCDSDFAKNALSLQEQQRRQQKELRDAILRITLMQEEEGCENVTKSRGKR
ncbi:uncharacterized protein TM35_000161610 [Trypanosoma theileri]|uniref:MIF4G domain-containing protein n=1 Tax=Trypanosoma theileri TaxID=67003 RepID=A0A1X0NVK7_9TRYP|nr:uncharacterized protein TM35_000161610 [Trypanosoma theileri]ORC88523.1 hypothetical protein TM35_000161610 [Trypanosoma theileri]